MSRCTFGQALHNAGITDPGRDELSSRAAHAIYGVGKTVVNDHRGGDCVCFRAESQVTGTRHEPTTGRVLIIDMERVPGLARFFDPKTKFIRADDVVESPRTICFAARWYGEKEPIFASEWDNRDEMTRKSWELYDEAQAVVTFNGRRFDDKHFRGLWFEAGLPAPRPWKQIDLFPIVKTQFGFEHNGLDAVLKRLGAPGKTDKYDAKMALAATLGDTAAQERIRAYNIGDIEGTEWLYDRLRGWMPNHPYIGAGDGQRCNQCGSTDLTQQPSRYRAVVMDYALLRCNHCRANLRSGWIARTATTRGIAA